jgi:hypothetical protein
MCKGCRMTVNETIEEEHKEGGRRSEINDRAVSE